MVNFPDLIKEYLKSKFKEIRSIKYLIFKIQFILEGSQFTNLLLYLY
jgi:hypothetical protein